MSTPTAKEMWNRRPRLHPGLREVVLVGALYVAYTSSRLLASNDQEAALDRAHVLTLIERTLKLNWEVSFNQFFLRHDTIGLLGCYWYSTAHYVVTLVVLVWLYFQGKKNYLPARRSLTVATVLALSLYLMLPTAPPRFIEGYVDILAVHANQGWWGSDASAPRGLGNLTNELAAFPSLHAGWSLWVALVLQRVAKHRWLKALGWLHAGITAAVVIGTANHWMMDVLVGWLVIIGGEIAVSAFNETHESPPPSKPTALEVHPVT